MTPLALHCLLGRCLAMSQPDIARRLTRGDVPWVALIGAANNALMGPALYAALARKGALGALPDDVRAYLAELHRRNAIRNGRLEAQAVEAIAALNRAGLVPIALKGAALLLDGPDGSATARMITDLDLLVEEDEAHRVVDALTGLGYAPLPANPSARHAIGDFVRVGDAGAIDLHIALINEPTLLPAASVCARAPLVQRKGAVFRRLTPNDRALHLLLHDLVQDRGAFDGRLNFRHLHELATWIESGEPIDWSAMRAHLDRHRLGPALDFWLLAASSFFGVPRPEGARISLAALTLLAQARLQLRYPALTRAGEILGNLRRSLAWYRLPGRESPLPRLRRAAFYLRMHRARMVTRVLHVLLHRRS